MNTTHGRNVSKREEWKHGTHGLVPLLEPMEEGEQLHTSPIAILHLHGAFSGQTSSQP